MSTRHRLGLQDFLLGSGTVTQVRSGKEVTIQRLGSAVQLTWSETTSAIADTNIDIAVATGMRVTGDTAGVTYILKDTALVGNDPETRTYDSANLATDGSWFKVEHTA